MRPARHARGTVPVFGENLNDSHSIRELPLAANGELDERRMKALPRPLTREARPEAVRRWVDQLDRAVRAHRAGGPVAAVVVHRDADGPDAAGAIGDQLAGQLSSIGGMPVVPVQTIEAWWSLFPDAVEAVRPSAWRGKLPRTPRNVELVVKPKAELCRATRTRGGPEYTEADSPVIAGNIRRLGLAPPPGHPCASYDHMAAIARSIR